MELPGSQAAVVLGVGPNVSICDLSDEVILEILESGPLGRGDLMDLCLACKRLRRIAITHLYKNIHIAGDRPLHQLLRSILQNASLGEMVKTLDLEWYGYTDCNVKLFKALRLHYNPHHDDARNFDREELESLADAAETLALNPDILRSLYWGSECAKAITIISSLQNLRALSVQPGSQATFFDLHFTRLATDGRSFTKLKHFDRAYCDNKGAFDLNLLFPAMFIPSLTTLVGFSASRDDNFYGDNDNDYDRRAGTSNVTCLALENSNVAGKRELSRVLRIPKGLRYLSISGRSPAGNYTTCSRDEFGRALGCTSQTLEYLSIVWGDYPKYDGSTLGPLRGFKRLRVLSVEFDVLLGFASEAAVELASVLPQTIEQLFLLRGQRGTWTEDEYLGSIERLIRAKGGSSMPALSFIGLQPGPELLAPLLNFAAEKGIEIASWDPQEMNVSHKTFPMPWYPLLEEILK